ncbi:MAG: twin-arginine translocase subunit TatC [Candidatus Symbiobacter sp.]|nr:twin-arginine translocase subunit TatC [Candidatus Symbiobacter sp.]
MSDVNNHSETSAMPIMAHLIELRKRLTWSMFVFLICFILCYYFSKNIFAFLAAPLAQLPEGMAAKKMIYTDLTEAFFTNVRIAFWAGLCLASPFISMQIWYFVAPGLYKKEKNAFLPFLIATPVLFLLGASLLYFVIMPRAWEFFASFQTSFGQDAGVIKVVLEPKVDQYLTLVMHLIFAFGLGFELPVFLTLLARVGLIKSGSLIAKRKIAILGIFIFAAIVTPPDAFSQIALAVPMVGLYELSILSVKFMERRRPVYPDVSE